MTVAGGLRLGIFDDSETSHYWSWHPYGALFGFVDGHVQFLNYSMDRSTFWKMGSRSGGEVLGEF
jgi:hypothetical protein